MKKTAGIAAGVLAALAIVITGGAWYTGVKFEQDIEQTLAEANQQLADATLGTGINLSLALESLERRVFGSTARYRLHADGRFDGERFEDVELLLVDQVAHGPFPISRLKRFDITPVMFESNFQLEETPPVAPWFQLTAGKSPLQGHAAVSYTQAMDGILRLTPLTVDLDESTQLAFSGLDMDFRIGKDVESADITATMKQLRIGATNTPEDHLEISGLTYRSEQAKGVAGLYLGDDELNIELIAFSDADVTAAAEGIRMDSTRSASGELVSLRSASNIDSLRYGGQSLGSLEMTMTMGNLDAQTISDMVELYNETMTRLVAESQGDELYGATYTEQEQARFAELMETLLAANPTLAIERFALKTDKGESHLSVGLGFAKPESFQLPPDELARQLVARLDAEVSVSKPMIAQIAEMIAREKEGLPVDEAQMQAQMMAEMAGGLAAGIGFAKVEGSDIVSNLHYADNEVDFNGKKMSPEAFVTMIAGGAMGGGYAPTMNEEQAHDSLEDERYAEPTESLEAEQQP